MKTMSKRNRASGALAIGVAAALVLFAAGSAGAQARIDGIAVADGDTLSFTAMAGEVSTPDGGAIHFYGYQEDGNLGGLPAGALPQYPGPTLILDQNSTISIALTSELPFGQRASIVFPGHSAGATGGAAGLVTQESTGAADTVTYTFTATQPGTYTYYSGTETDFQVEMGMVGTIIVRPIEGEDHAYSDPGTQFDHEYLFLLSSMDPMIHQKAEQGLFSEIDMTARWPVYWFINGRAGPDDLVGANVGWLPHQPYNCTPRMTPGQKVLVRMVGADLDQHPLHLHGNHYREIARYGRMLKTDSGAMGSRQRFTTLSVPGQTVDAIFTWTGEKMGWDIYGGTDVDMPHTCNGKDVGQPQDLGAPEFDPQTNEYCADHGEPFPVTLPEKQNLAFGGWWSGSPYMGGAGTLPPGEGGLNANGGYFFMWHSHTEKELANFDIFPGGMLSMMVVEPPATVID